ncbi:LolA-like outer membrane lipoprotein chaperone [Campylobacter sp.]|uniref:LolA-like outer membrane lipoprotein chaperone n=1 Tax=Campylobacter sp. TaxID=205 RepID=UPI00270EE805|nr:LolA-like outer membrane lipoprotein chaperone [Campylobacter sp.]
MKKISAILLFCTAVFANSLSFKTLESDFIQTITSNDTNIDYYGKFYAREDNKALWIYDKPTPKKIYFDKNRVVVIEDELEQAIISRLENTPNLASILKKATRIKDDLYKTKFDDVEYFIAIKNDLPTRIDYQDKLGNKIKILFENAKKDEAISEEILTPVIPSFYDVINQ